jgi:hypothetical protein
MGQINYPAASGRGMENDLPANLRFPLQSLKSRRKRRGIQPLEIKIIFIWSNFLTRKTFSLKIILWRGLMDIPHFSQNKF